MSSQTAVMQWAQRCGRGLPVTKAAALLVLAAVLGGCGGGGGGGGDWGTDGGTNYTPGDGSGTALLTWEAPSAREDGGALGAEEIGGYRIHFGPSSDPEQYVIQVEDSGRFQYQVTGLPPDTYEFAVSALDTTGQESSYSNSMTKVIDY